MFDYIEVRMTLPAEPAPPKNPEFQTKDTPEQFLVRYVINEDGRLIELGYRVEDRSDAALGIGLDRLAGCATRIYDTSLDKVINYHGDIGFGQYDGKTGEDWDYIARFTDGRCVRIWLNEYTPPSSTG